MTHLIESSSDALSAKHVPIAARVMTIPAKPDNISYALLFLFKEILKVLLISAKNNGISWIPIGLLSITAELEKNGNQVHLFDRNMLNVKSIKSIIDFCNNHKNHPLNGGQKRKNDMEDFLARAHILAKE